MGKSKSELVSTIHGRPQGNFRSIRVHIQEEPLFAKELTTLIFEADGVPRARELCEAFDQYGLMDVQRMYRTSHELFSQGALLRFNTNARNQCFATGHLPRFPRSLHCTPLFNIQSQPSLMRKADSYVDLSVCPRSERPTLSWRAPEQ
jgi:hypothetical protein